MSKNNKQYSGLKNLIHAIFTHLKMQQLLIL
jgi:hypothetical protein